MTENRENFAQGSSTVEGFFGWINERHAIYHRRFIQNLPKPWTADPVMLDFKFTNVFRELDRGTLALRKIDQQISQFDSDELVFNTWWYRLFNLDTHNRAMKDYDDLEGYMVVKWKAGEQIFTGAHMVRGEGGEAKIWPYLRLAKIVWERRWEMLDNYVNKFTTLKEAFDFHRTFRLIGDFTAYELCCDLRWHLLKHATDVLTWGNTGNGALRGMKRLGMPPTSASMRQLWAIAPLYLAGWVKPSWELAAELPLDYSTYTSEHLKPFEIREIEHSLCEFDKYERARTGLGRPRARYNGRA